MEALPWLSPSSSPTRATSRCRAWGAAIVSWEAPSRHKERFPHLHVARHGLRSSERGQVGQTCFFHLPDVRLILASLECVYHLLHSIYKVPRPLEEEESKQRAKQRKTRKKRGRALFIVFPEISSNAFLRSFLLRILPSSRVHHNSIILAISLPHVARKRSTPRTQDFIKKRRSYKLPKSAENTAENGFGSVDAGCN